MMRPPDFLHGGTTKPHAKKGAKQADGGIRRILGPGAGWYAMALAPWTCGLLAGRFIRAAPRCSRVINRPGRRSWTRWQDTGQRPVVGMCSSRAGGRQGTEASASRCLFRLAKAVTHGYLPRATSR